MAATSAQAFQSLAETLKRNQKRLDDLDTAIGDGDHGTNVVRGFTATAADPALADATPKAALKIAALALIGKVGGTSGPLLGTFFLRATASLPDPATPAGLVEAFQKGLDGVTERGKASPGEKTMVDAMAPAAAALRANAEKGFGAMLEAAARAALEGAEKTVAMRAAKGRASYLGERSVGHMDPGALTVALSLRAVADVFKNG